MYDNNFKKIKEFKGLIEYKIDKDTDLLIAKFGRSNYAVINDKGEFVLKPQYDKIEIENGKTM